MKVSLQEGEWYVASTIRSQEGKGEFKRRDWNHRHQRRYLSFPQTHSNLKETESFTERVQRWVWDQAIDKKVPAPALTPIPSLNAGSPCKTTCQSLFPYWHLCPQGIQVSCVSFNRSKGRRKNVLGSTPRKTLNQIFLGSFRPVSACYYTVAFFF